MKIENLLYNTIYTDAFTRPFSGMSAGHIKAHYSGISGYFNSEEAYKDHPERWTKPGLYGWITQLGLFCVSAGKMRFIEKNDIVHLLETCIGTPENRMRVVRGNDLCVQDFLHRDKHDNETVILRPGCSPVLLSVLFSLSIAPKKPAMKQIIRFTAHFTRNSDTVAASLLWDRIVRSVEYYDNSLFTAADKELAALLQDRENIQPLCFSNGIHPDGVEQSLRHFQAVLRYYIENGIEGGKKSHILYVNSLLKSPVTRVTIDHPLLLPFHAITLAEMYKNGDGGNKNRDTHILSAAIEEGGESGLAAVMALLLCNDENFTDEYPFLAEDLVNKKKIIQYAQKSAAGLTEAELAEFFTAEQKLTAKEEEERNAILKHAKKKPAKKRPPKGRKRVEEQLSAHIVESWTKKDKARYKREQRKQKKTQDDGE